MPTKAACRLQKSYYRAKEAHACYKEVLSTSREGISLDPESFYDLDCIISNGVKNGQSPAHIINAHSGSIPISRRTVYHYFADNLFSVGNLDLPRKVRYRIRKKKRPPQSPEKIKANRDMTHSKSIFMIIQALKLLKLTLSMEKKMKKVLISLLY
jgi:IS30 family transposase